jgi:glycosyltransferase involved in cell wall biosynthesis
VSHIALVIPTLDRLAGAERQVILLAGGLAARNWNVSVVALSGNGGDSRIELLSRGVEFFSLEMRKGIADPRGWIRFRSWLRRTRPDVVHAHLPHAAWISRWSRLAAPIPRLIDSIHTSATGSWGRRAGYRMSRWLPDLVSAVSESAAESWRSTGMVSPNRLVVIPNGVDVEHWRPNPDARDELRRRLGFTDEFLWFAAGRLDSVKDYASLLWAMREIPKPAHLLIAGAGPEEGSLRRLAVQFGIESRVRFLGFQPDVLPWMQAADAFVLSSRWEGLPVSLLEAGACALPAVATDVPGTREVLVNRRTGILASPRDTLALRSAMQQMMHLAPEARAATGLHARNRVIEHFSLVRALDRWETLYLHLSRQKQILGAPYLRALFARKCGRLPTHNNPDGL